MANYKLDYTGDELNNLPSEVSQLKEELEELKHTGGGLSEELKQAWKMSFTEMAFASASHPYTDVLIELLDGDVPPTPPDPTKELESIEVAWTSESADEGANPRTLIAYVMANYTDGTTEAVTGYTVSPSALVVGANTVTVAYGGKSATKTITGIHHSTEPTVVFNVDLTSSPNDTVGGIEPVYNSTTSTEYTSDGHYFGGSAECLQYNFDLNKGDTIEVEFGTLVEPYANEQMIMLHTNTIATSATVNCGLVYYNTTKNMRWMYNATYEEDNLNTIKWSDISNHVVRVVYNADGTASAYLDDIKILDSVGTIDSVKALSIGMKKQSIKGHVKSVKVIRP